MSVAALLLQSAGEAGGDAAVSPAVPVEFYLFLSSFCS
jgi:hypothetical protein